MSIKRKNILLVSPTISDEDRKITRKDIEHNWWSPHYGVIRLTSFLRANGHNAEYFDTILGMIKKGKGLEEKLREKKWDIIGFSMLDTTLLTDIHHTYLASKICPDALLIAGGQEAQFNYQTVLDKSPCKIVVLGEGEKPLLMLANDVPKDKIPGIIFRNNAVSLTEGEYTEVTKSIEWEMIPYEEYWDYYVERFGNGISESLKDAIHSVRIFTKNSCFFRCKFCPQINQIPHAVGVNKISYVSVPNDYLIDIIKRIKNAHKRVRTIYFTDDDFWSNKEKAIDFCKKTIEEKIGLKFICQARITDLTEDVIQWMKKANFIQVNIGIESFSEKVLREINKHCNKEIMLRHLALLEKYELRAGMFLILITPKSTLNDIEETIDETLRWLSSSSFSAGFMLACVPLKGSQFYEEEHNFFSKLQEIQGTGHSIKRNLMIYAEDPIVKEVQLRYYQEVERLRQEEFKKTKYLKTNFSTSLFSLNFLKQLIRETREKYNLPVN